MSSQEISIKQLPIIDEVNTGDLILVQTPNATSVLDFDNFVIGLDNTSFGPTISGHTTKINALSSVFDDNFFNPASLITNQHRLVLSANESLPNRTVVGSVDQTLTYTYNTLSGVENFEQGQAGNPANQGFMINLSNIAIDQQVLSSNDIKQENVFEFFPAFLPITITHGGVNRVYYFMLSAAGLV